nr:hypothetical protein [Tanacetum cinerariifolium]
YCIDHQPQSIQEDLNQQRMNDVHNIWTESRNELLNTMQSLCKMILQREQAANLSNHTSQPSRRFNSIRYNDDDNEESTIYLNETVSQLPPSIAITPVLPTMKPEDSLIMRDEDLRTIPKKESNEFIKSSVEDLAPIPKESEDTSDSDKECDFPFCDNFVTFSNPLFNVNDDFTSSNDESLPEEDVQEENFKIYSNPLFEFDDKYIFTLLVTPLSDANEDECFDPGGDINKIDANVSTDIEDVHGPKNLKDEPDNNLKNMVKVFDLEIHEKIISPTYVRLPLEDRHYFSFTFFIRIFLPYLTYSENAHFLLSSRSEDTIFDLGISAYSFYSLEPVAYESPVMIFPFFCFCPKDKGIRGESS